MSNVFVKEDGTLINVDYNPTIHKIGKNAAKSFIYKVLDTYKPIGAVIEFANQEINDEYEIKIKLSSKNEKIFYLGIGDTQSGGNTRPTDEHRIQLNGQLYNDLYIKKQSGKNTALLGVYKWNSFINLGEGENIDQYIICAWEPTPTNSTSPLSKQIKAKTISEAILEGFSRYHGSNFTACAFRPELLYYYLNTNTELHNEICENIEEDNYMVETKPFTELNYKPISKDKKYKSYNRIVFGAPGTGKSFQLKQESTDGNHFANIERVTFHPDYSYGQFVGNYKPVSDDEGRIRYEYVPGPFMRTLVKALESGKNGDSAEKFLLIVEEINRAKVAAVFGDMFQLLDRTDAGDSVYEIQASEDVRRYLARELGGTKENYTSIKIPNNMYIWATMNSADQGVFPMDTAFKRRWEFTYLSINANEKKIAIEDLPIINGDAKIIKWNILRKSINNMLLKECKVNEDKLLGPFFISGEVFKNATSNTDAFFEAFNSKVLMYLFEDAGKMHQKKLFAGIDQNELTFSKVCEDFKTRGTAIFGNSFQLVKE